MYFLNFTRSIASYAREIHISPGAGHDKLRVTLVLDKPFLAPPMSLTDAVELVTILSTANVELVEQQIASLVDGTLVYAKFPTGVYHPPV